MVAPVVNVSSSGCACTNSSRGLSIRISLPHPRLEDLNWWQSSPLGDSESVRTYLIAGVAPASTGIIVNRRSDGSGPPILAAHRRRQHWHHRVPGHNDIQSFG